MALSVTPSRDAQQPPHALAAVVDLTTARQDEHHAEPATSASTTLCALAWTIELITALQTLADLDIDRHIAAQMQDATEWTITINHERGQQLTRVRELCHQLGAHTGNGDPCPCTPPADTP